MKGWFDELRVIVSKAIGAVIIPLLPLYIFGIFLNMTMLGQVGTILMTFMAIIVVIFVIHVAVLLIQYSIAGAVTGKNPLKMLWTMLPAYFTALGTQSSAATIPVTMAQVKKAGVRPGIAGFCRAAVRYHPSVGQYAQDRGLRAGADVMQGQPYDTAMFAGFIAMLGITMIACSRGAGRRDHGQSRCAVVDARFQRG